MKTLLDSKLLRLTTFDNEIREEGHLIIGIDEAGRGPLCGPVVAAAVIFPEFTRDVPQILTYLDDSKKFSGTGNIKKREEIFEYLTHCGCIYAIEEGSLEEIEEYNIYQTTYRIMFRAYKNVVKQLKKQKYMVLVDGTKNIKDIPEKVIQHAIPKGDGKSASIAAASILAKVYRDKIMYDLAKEFPEYKWDKNKGYGTKEHIEAIRQHGRCRYHRQSFKIKGLDYEEEK
ncbi:MAG: ribonuclease HII [Cyanobacteriota bacterium]